MMEMNLIEGYANIGQNRSFPKYNIILAIQKAIKNTCTLKQFIHHKTPYAIETSPSGKVSKGHFLSAFAYSSCGKCQTLIRLFRKLHLETAPYVNAS